MALRGFIPGAPVRPAEPEPRPDDPASLVVVLVLLCAAVGVVVMAVVGRVRRSARAPAASGSRPDWLRGDSGRPTWRVALVAFASVLAWLALAAWLNRWSIGVEVDPPAAGTSGAEESTGDAPEIGSDTAPPVDTPPSPQDSGTDLIDWFTAATVVFLVVLAVGTLLARRRVPRAEYDAPASDDPVAPVREDSENLARAAELGLAEVEDPDREPRKAIIACYAAMERELARTPDAAPRDFDTASEVLARAVDHHAVRPGAATRLVDLFDEARFSPHVMDEGHRETAVAVLTEVLADMQGRL